MIALKRENRRRVVVTGMGSISSMGGSADALWESVSKGKSGISKIKNFDVSDFPVQIGGEVSNELLNGDLTDKFISKSDRGLVFGLSAAGRALRDAGFAGVGREPIDAGCIVGSGLGPCHDAESNYATYTRKGWRAIRPMTISKLMFNAFPSRMSIMYKLLGEHHAIASACASGAQAIGRAVMMVRSGMEDVTLAGGCDSPLTPSIYGAWISMRILSMNPDPERASRPFDRDRDGLVLAEGATMLVVEELEHARRRGARIYAEIIGYGASSDATHITSPSPEGQSRAIRKAVEDAHVQDDEIGYINAHGTSTIANDVAETKAIKMAFGKRAYDIPVSSSKSMTGHPMGSGGALELCITIEALLHQTLPPTVNLDVPDSECDLDYVPKTARTADFNTAISNSFAFGGSNSVIVVKTFDD